MTVVRREEWRLTARNSESTINVTHALAALIQTYSIYIELLLIKVTTESKSVKSLYVSVGEGGALSTTVLSQLDDPEKDPNNKAKLRILQARYSPSFWPWAGQTSSILQDMGGVENGTLLEMSGSGCSSIALQPAQGVQQTKYYSLRQGLWQ